MKKIYITPIVEEINMQNEESLMTGSINNNLGIGYGGLDTEGNNEPEVPVFNFGIEED